MFRNYFIAGLALLFSQSIFGIENYITHSTTPYPPACVSTADLADVFTPSSTRAVYASDFISLTASPDTGAKVNVEMEIYRRGCVDENRSVMFMSANAITTGSVYIPRLFAEIGGTRYPLRLVTEPNSFEQTMGGSLQPGGFAEYIMDGVAESAVAGTANIISPEQYNGAWTLIIQDGFDANQEFEVQIDAYTGFQKPLKFAFNGRMTGNWVSDGATDQGFLITFNEFINNDGVQNQMFLSWYTFDTDGSTLWLVADSFHDTGEDSIELSIQKVTNGVFMGSQEVNRTNVGTATLTAENCNEMTFTYDLASLGLGADTVTLKRIFSLETAGFACRDQAARIEAL
jgi:hypothetical protein